MKTSKMDKMESEKTTGNAVFKTGKGTLLSWYKIILGT